MKHIKNNIYVGFATLIFAGATAVAAANTNSVSNTPMDSTYGAPNSTGQVSTVTDTNEESTHTDSTAPQATTMKHHNTKMQSHKECASDDKDCFRNKDSAGMTEQ